MSELQQEEITPPDGEPYSVYGMKPVSPLQYASSHLTEKFPNYEEYYCFAVDILDYFYEADRLMGGSPPPGWKKEWWLG